MVVDRVAASGAVLLELEARVVSLVYGQCYNFLFPLRTYKLLGFRGSMSATVTLEISHYYDYVLSSPPSSSFFYFYNYLLISCHRHRYQARILICRLMHDHALD